MRRLTGAINKTQCVVLFTNQIREKIGVMFGSPETQPGGRAQSFSPQFVWTFEESVIESSESHWEPNSTQSSQK